MVNKQTAVDWLKKKCQDSLDREPDDANEKEIGYSMALNHIITLIDLEAKQMEKDQTGDWVETHWYEEIDGKNYKLYYNKNNEWK